MSPVSKSADNINPLKPTESFDPGHVLLTLIDAVKRAETVYLDSALGAQAAPISFYPPINTTPTSELDYCREMSCLKLQPT